jgi:hypothetical protein
LPPWEELAEVEHGVVADDVVSEYAPDMVELDSDAVPVG